MKKKTKKNPWMLYSLPPLSAYSKACTFFRELINIKYRPTTWTRPGCFAWLNFVSLPETERKHAIQLDREQPFLSARRQMQKANSRFLFRQPTMLCEPLGWERERKRRGEKKVASRVLMLYSCAKRFQTKLRVDLTECAKTQSTARTYCHPELI